MPRKKGGAYVSKGDITILIFDEDSIAIKEGFIVRSERDSLELNKKYWTSTDIDDSEFFCYYFGLTIDRDSLYLDTFKNYGAGYVVDCLNELAIDSILPKKSKFAEERENRKDNKGLELPAVIERAVF